MRRGNDEIVVEKNNRKNNESNEDGDERRRKEWDHQCGSVMGVVSPAASGLQSLRVELHDLSEESPLVLTTHARALVGDHHHQPALGRAGGAWLTTTSWIGWAVDMTTASTTAANSRNTTSGQARRQGRG